MKKDINILSSLIAEEKNNTRSTSSNLIFAFIAILGIILLVVLSIMIKGNASNLSNQVKKIENNIVEIQTKQVLQGAKFRKENEILNNFLRNGLPKIAQNSVTLDFKQLESSVFERIKPIYSNGTDGVANNEDDLFLINNITFTISDNKFLVQYTLETRDLNVSVKDASNKITYPNFYIKDNYSNYLNGINFNKKPLETATEEEKNKYKKQTEYFEKNKELFSDIVISGYTIDATEVEAGSDGSGGSTTVAKLFNTKFSIQLTLNLEAK